MRPDNSQAKPISWRGCYSSVASILLAVAATTAPAVEPPRVLDGDWQIELIASEPELVTPVGCCFDASGRLLVIECHTHFPPDDYDGPDEDRIYLFDDSDGDGVLDRQRLFYQGGSATMGVAALPDGSIVVATRSEVALLRDRDGDDRADQRQVLLTLKTEASYPHNGLAGLAVGPNGSLYVGQGENLGAPYELIGADGSKQVGGGEGGNVFRCRPDGGELERIATGFWNPFALFVDPAGRLWAAGNDPDAMPPCRLLHVARGGDYGFQFRFGRAGTHPLQSWDGEFPGTMPMAAGTGEAPCAVVGLGDRLWVSSWGDNRIERYQLRSEGATWTSQTEVVVQGDAGFRPAGMAVAPDASIYLTDWTDRSYPVHGKGRLWRLSRKQPASPDQAKLPALSEPEQSARRLSSDPDASIGDRLRALDNDDPFIRQAATIGLVHSDALSHLDRSLAVLPRQRVGLLTAMRWSELAKPESVSAALRRDWIAWGLRDASSDVVLAAVRWATERDCREHREAIRELLDRDDVSAAQFAAVIASLAYLETGSAAAGRRDPAREQMLYEFAADSNRPASLRSLAIRMLPPEAERPTDQQLGQWLSEQRDRDLSREAVRLLAARGSPAALEQLATIAADRASRVETRADAAAALGPSAGRYSAVLNKLSLPREDDVLRREARRILRRSWRRGEASRPKLDDLDGWDRLVGSGGNADAGRRVFFRATCANCHAHSGRGAKTGPDLTTLAGQMTSQRLIESILSPSKEIGPLYVPWRVLTVNGQLLTGLKLDAAGVGDRLRFQGADGMTFEVPLEQIDRQDPIAQSIMPTGLEEAMSLDEFRDLVAFLIGSDRDQQ